MLSAQGIKQIQKKFHYCAEAMHCLIGEDSRGSPTHKLMHMYVSSVKLGMAR